MSAGTHHDTTRDELLALAVEVAPRLLGGLLTTVVDGEEVTVRLTEVEAYHGLGSGEVHDPGSHARMGRTARNATMWGEPGHLYVYLSHGLHSCANVVCGPEGRGDGVLLRAGEIVVGHEIALRRREARGVVRAARDLARGPGRLGDALALRHPVHDGIDFITHAPLAGASVRLRLADAPPAATTGPRVGVAGIAGTAAFPWRFFLAGDPTVSPFRPGRGAA